MSGLRRLSQCIVLGLLGFALAGASHLNYAAVRQELDQVLPHAQLAQAFTPLVFRAPSPPPMPAKGEQVYQQSVDGVVLIASTRTLGTGVLVSGQGDIVTNDHVVEAAHRTQGHDWVAVWFKPPPGVTPTAQSFLIGRVLERDQRRDLARIRVEIGVPAAAKAVRLASDAPAIGQDVFTIGHPQAALWALGHGKVTQIRPGYQWTYRNGPARSATTIQTSAPVNPGDSGGPLLDTDGTIVGIVVGSAATKQGVYYAVSVKHVRDLLQPPSQSRP
jgi:S1-C subfamily serine protease